MPVLRPALALFALLYAVLPARGGDQKGVPKPGWGAFFSERDQRVPMEPTAWPWRAIGRVNIADRVNRRHCTGTLVGARLVLTAGHCLFNHRLGRWAKPKNVHFVAGQARDTSAGHSTAAELIIPERLDIARGTEPRLGTIRRGLIAHDWALILLETTLPVKPVPVKAIAAHAFAREVAAGVVARAGYSADRQYLLSVHRGCAAALIDRWPGAMLNRCDARPGDSGSPLLFFRGDEVFVIGLSTAAAHAKRGRADYVALAGLGPSAISFADTVVRALQR